MKRHAFGLTIAASLAALAWLVWRSNFLIDDAFISFRYARNWADGHGLVFNLAEDAAVEGYSNFLWVALLALAAKLGAAPELAAGLLSVACGTGLLIQLGHYLRGQLGLARDVVAYGLLGLALFPPFAVWCTGGLETAAFAWALFALHVRLQRSAGKPFVTALLGLAVCLLRPEGFLWAAGLALLAAIPGLARGTARGTDGSDERQARRSLRTYALLVALGFGLFLTWRRLTYDAWLPNTVQAKAGFSTAVLARGLENTATFGLLFVWPLLAPLGLFGARRTAAWGQVRAALLVVLAGLTYNLAVGGDWMPMFRFLAPLAGFFVILGAFALSRLPARARGLTALVAVGIALLPAFGRAALPRTLLEPVYFRSFQGGYQSEWQRLQRGRENVANFTTIGRGLKLAAPAGSSITCGAIGALGYHSDLFIYDRNGLIDPAVAARPAGSRQDGANTAGHDKRVPRAFFIEERPTYFEAIVFDRRAPRKARQRLSAMVFRDSDEAVLKSCTVMDELEFDASGDFKLLVLRYTPDRTEAEAFWRE